MKAKMIMGVLVVTVFVLAACGSVNNGEQDGGAALAGIHWVLLALDGQPPLVGTTITAEFSEEQITGVSGCNSYFGDYTIDGGKLQFDMIGMTAMACLEPEGVMAQESAYADLLQEVRSVRLDGAGADQRLELLDESGAVRLLYARQAIPASDPAELIGTQWELLTLDGSPLDADMRFTLAFEEDRYRGLAGCRHFEGEYQAEGGEISFPSTTMLEETCPGAEDAYYALEGQFTDSLTWARYWQIVEGELEIQTARGGVLRFKRAGALPDPSLAGMAWELQTLNGQPPLADAVPTLAFSEREISGVTGCNRYFGMYKAADGALTFGTMGVTEMYCMDPPGVMEQEQAFLAALGSVRSYQLTAERLDMLDAAGEVVLSFTPSASL